MNKVLPIVVAMLVVFAAGAAYYGVTYYTPVTTSFTSSTTEASSSTASESTTETGSTYESTTSTTTTVTTAETAVQEALRMVVNNAYSVRLNGTHSLLLLNVTMTNANAWNMSVPWAIKSGQPGGNVIDYRYRHPTAYPYCWDKDSWGGISLVTRNGAEMCLRTLATLSNISLRSAQYSATFNGYKELRPGQSLVQLLGFVMASTDSPSRLQYSCAPRVDPNYGYVITCVNQEELYSPGSSCGWMGNQTCGPAFSASTSDFAVPIPVSVVNASSYSSTTTLPSGKEGTYTTTPDVPWLNQDQVDQELAPSIDQAGGGCPTSCSYVHAGQTIDDFTVVVGLGTLFKVDSVQGVNPDFAVTSQSTWSASYCTAGATRWHLTFVIPQSQYGSVALPYRIQFQSAFNFNCS